MIFRLININNSDMESEFDACIHQWTSIMQHLSNLEAILNTAVDAIITIEASGIVESVNPATEVLFGYTAAEILGNNVSMLMPAPYCDEHDQYIANYLRSGVAKIIGSGREVVGKRKDGSTFPMHLAVSEIEVHGKRMFSGIIRDISDLRAAKAKLREANEMLTKKVSERTAELEATQAQLLQQEKLSTIGRVAGGIAFEIRNPLHAVRTSVYYLGHAKNPKAEKIHEHLMRIDQQVAKIDNVVTALSEVTRMRTPVIEPHSVADIVRSVINKVTLPSEVTCELELEDDLPQVLADIDQLTMVLSKLIRNAGEAMPTGGKITIFAEVFDADLKLVVADEAWELSSITLTK